MHCLRLCWAVCNLCHGRLQRPKAFPFGPLQSALATAQAEAASATGSAAELQARLDLANQRARLDRDASESGIITSPGRSPGSGLGDSQLLSGKVRTRMTPAAPMLYCKALSRVGMCQARAMAGRMSSSFHNLHPLLTYTISLEAKGDRTRLHLQTHAFSRTALCYGWLLILPDLIALPLLNCTCWGVLHGPMLPATSCRDWIKTGPATSSPTQRPFTVARLTRPQVLSQAHEIASLQETLSSVNAKRMEAASENAALLERLSSAERQLRSAETGYQEAQRQVEQYTALVAIKDKLLQQLKAASSDTSRWVGTGKGGERAMK